MTVMVSNPPNGQQAPQPEPGIRCPKCHCRHLFVVYTRPRANGTLRRKRQCRYCGKQFLTTEKAVE